MARIEPGSGVSSVIAPLVLRGRSRFFALVATAPALLLLSHLLPATGAGLALRLAGAAACVFLLPGALVLRALGWPSPLGVAVAASFALSLAVVGLAVALMFAVGASIVFAAGVVAAVSACAAVSAAVRTGEAKPVSRADGRAFVAVLATSVPLAGIVWWAAGPLVGDPLVHAARIVKLAEFDSLSTLSTVNEFEDGGLHPGYAFPLLHGAEALVARLAGVPGLDVIVYLPAVLVPLALVLAYGAGCAVFRSSAGGLALVVALVAQVGLSRGDALIEGTGVFELLSQPQAVSRLLLFPAMVALAFAFVVDGGWVLLASLAAAAFALSAVHPTYAPYIALVLGGFLVARVLLARGWEPLLTRAALVLGAVLVPFGLVLVLLLPMARETRAVTPSPEQRAAELARNGNSFTEWGDWFGYSPQAIAREGPVVVAGLLAIPLAGFAARRLWAALVLGGSLAVLTVLLTPPLFTALSDAFSVSQSRRLASFIPIAFAVAGACVVLSRLRSLGVVLAAGAGILLVLLYPGEFARMFVEGGPESTVVVAVAGGVAALVVGAILRPRGPSPSAWTVAVAVAFAVPASFSGLSKLERVRPVVDLTPGVAAAVRAETARGDVVFSDPETSLEVSAVAPVYVNSAPVGNVADTPKNRPRARIADARRVLANTALPASERRRILARYGADWVLVDKRGSPPAAFLATLPLVFEDSRYALYRVG
jgi:hypothetical protein